MLTDEQGNPINSEQPEELSESNGAEKPPGVSDVRCASLSDIVFTLVHTTNNMMRMEGELIAMKHFAEKQKMVGLPEGGEEISQALVMMKHQIAVMNAEFGRRTHHIDMGYWNEIGVVINEDGSRSLPEQSPELAS